MILLGQHGQRQDYAVGLDHIRYAAQTCDENAPQGAYVCDTTPPITTNIKLTIPGLWDAASSRTASGHYSR